MIQPVAKSTVNPDKSDCCAAAEQEEIMNMNHVGKFESRQIVNEFDSALIELFGINMTDARITRYEVLSSFAETRCARKSALQFAAQRGIRPLV